MHSPAGGPRAPGPWVDPATQQVTLRIDHDGRCTPTRVWFHLRDYGADPTFHREGEHWVARIPRPPVDRLEYLISLAWPDGGHSMVPDPANPNRVRSVFGDKSVIEFSGYVRPWWLSVADATEAQARRDAEAVRAATRRAAMTGRPGPRGHLGAPNSVGLVAVAMPAISTDRLGSSGRAVPGEGIASVRVRAQSNPGDDRIRRASGGPIESTALVAGPTAAEVVDPDAALRVTGQLFVPADSTPTEPLPLLVVHDGPEYADLADLLRYIVTVARLEPGLRCRVLLLEPVDRDRSYSASPAYARALVTRMLPDITDAMATAGRPVGATAVSRRPGRKAR